MLNKCPFCCGTIENMQMMPCIETPLECTICFDEKKLFIKFLCGHQMCIDCYNNMVDINTHNRTRGAFVTVTVTNTSIESSYSFLKSYIHLYLINIALQIVFISFIIHQTSSDNFVVLSCCFGIIGTMSLFIMYKTLKHHPSSSSFEIFIAMALICTLLILNAAVVYFMIKNVYNKN